MDQGAESVATILVNTIVNLNAKKSEYSDNELTWNSGWSREQRERQEVDQGAGEGATYFLIL